MKRFFAYLLSVTLLVGVAWASDVTLTSRVDYLNTRNNGADDAAAIMARLEKPIWHEFSLAAEFDANLRQYFPVTDDPKGAFGSLMGYGFVPEVIFRPVVTEKFSPYIFGGVGYYWWDFKENPFLQDNHVTIKVDPSVGYKGGIGFNYWLNEHWSINVEASYFHSEIPKDARDDKGQRWGILGDECIGNEIWRVGAGLTYRFS